MECFVCNICTSGTLNESAVCATSPCCIEPKAHVHLPFPPIGVYTVQGVTGKPIPHAKLWAWLGVRIYSQTISRVWFGV